MTSTRRLSLLLFGLPALLIVVAFWQQRRVRERAVGLPEAQKLANDNLRDLKQLVSRDSTAVVQVEGHDTRYAAFIAVPILGQRADELQTAGRVQRWLEPIPRTGMFAGLLAILIGGGGLLLLRSAAHRAMRSRDDLIVSFDRARRLLPFIIAGVTVALAIALAATMGYESLNFWRTGLPSRASGKIMILFAMGALAALWVMGKALIALPRAFAIFTPSAMVVPAQEITRQAAPGFWQWIDGLAEQAGTRPPSRIIAGVRDSFFVTSNPVTLEPSGLALTGTVLHVPLDEMALLDQDETSAIIGHELGHFCGADTKYTERFLPIYAGIQRSLDTVSHAGTQRNGEMDPMMLPAHALGNWCMDRFHEAVMHWSRVREHEADRIGATIAGANVSASALVRTLASLEPIHTVFARVRTNVATAPADLVEEVRRVAARDGLGNADRHLETQIAHPTDSHPPTSERLQAFGETVPLSDELRARALRPVNAEGAVWYAPLFVDASALCRNVTRDYVAAVGQVEAQFDELLDAIASKAQAKKELTERTIFTVLLMVMLATLAGGFGVALIAANLFKQRVFAVCLLLIAAALLYAAYYYWRRGQSPIMQLSAEGFTLYGATPLIPWSNVDDINFTQVQQMTSTMFLLAEGYVPAIANRHRRRVHWKLKKRTLTLSVSGMKGLKTQQFVDLVVEYYHAGQARALRGEREAARGVE